MAATSSLKLHGAPQSNNFERARIYMAEKGLPFELVTVDLMKGEHKTEEYAKINPRQQVPCLLDGDIPLYESTAIIQYLERKFPDPPLLPENDKDLAVSLTRQAEFLAKLDNVNIMGSVVVRGQTLAELGERADKLLNELQVWDGYLEGRDYLANTFSIADIYVFPFVSPYYEVLLLPEAKFPNLGAWYARCKARPAINNSDYWSALQIFVKAFGNENCGIFADL